MTAIQCFNGIVFSEINLNIKLFPGVENNNNFSAEKIQCFFNQEKINWTFDNEKCPVIVPLNNH